MSHQRDRAHPFIIDVEASGFGADSYPIEVGVALEEGRRFCTLIMPQPGWTHWDQNAEKVHHLSRDILQRKGRTIDEVTDHLNHLLGGKTLYSDGWVVDKPWLITLFQAAGKDMAFTVSPLELLLSEEQMAIWHHTKAKVIEDLKLTRHRASNDALIVQETYRLTQEQVGVRQG